MNVGLFPGQGLRPADVAAALPAEHPRVQHASELLGYDLVRRVEQSVRAGKGSLTTSLAQPAIFVAGLVAFEDAEAGAEHFHALLGHSLGEYTALVAAGAIGFADGVNLVATRGRLMHRAATSSNGGMAVLSGLRSNDIERVCREAEVEFANDNSPTQVVIAGDLERLAIAADLVRSMGGRSVLLPVDGAFHTSAMESAAEGLRDCLEATAIRMPHIAVYSNVSAAPYRAPGEIRSLLVQQLTGRVRFRECVAALVARGVERFVDLGPGRVVGRLAEATAAAGAAA